MAMFLGVAFSVCWAALTLLAGLMGSAGIYSIAMVFDVLRYGAWYAFVFALLRPTERSQAFLWVFATAVAIIVAGVAG
jgi:hypothetical protein